MDQITTSIVINNYNYAQFLREAIDSALAQTYEDVEVVVVDDGSTDGSREIIKSYGDAIVAVLQENAGQASAMNTGFENATGEIILFLDSDDRLDKDCLTRALAYWEMGDSILLYQMRVIDGAGDRTGLHHPADHAMPKGSAKEQVLRHGNYPAPPTSGLIFSRQAVAKIFPTRLHQDECSIDSLLRILTPFLGGSRFVHEVLADYRIHNQNFSVNFSRIAKLRRVMSSNLIKQDQLEALGESEGFEVPPGLFQGNLMDLKGRLASLRLDKAGHPLPDDSRFGLWLAGLLLAARASGFGLGKRLSLAGWFSLVALLPLFFARPTIELAYREATIKLKR